MNTMTLRSIIAVPVFIVLLLLGVCTATGAQPGAASELDIILKINRLEETLTRVDELYAALGDPESGAAGTSPAAQVRGMLQGTDWIDTIRSVVMGVSFKEGSPTGALLIPYRTPNENFQAAFNATVGPDYYVLGLPPGQPFTLSETAEAELADAAQKIGSDSVSVQIAMGGLIQRGKQQVRKLTDKLDRMPAKKRPKMGPTPQDMKEMTARALEISGQLDTITIGLNFGQKNLTLSVEAEARGGTELAWVFQAGGRETYLDNYRPRHQMNFRSGSFDINGMLKIFEDVFGKIYETMGMDFQGIARICKPFTGEGAGGVSFGKDGMVMEGIYVLKSPEAAENYLETQYIPWFITYGENISRMVETELGKKRQLMSRTPDTTVAGRRVAGIRMSFPPEAVPPGKPELIKMQQMYSYTIRMTTVDNLLLFAGDDKRIGQLIAVAKTLKKGARKGPLMSGDFNMTEYTAAMMAMMPKGTAGTVPIPDLGRWTFTGDLGDGRASMTAAIGKEDLKAMMASFNRLKPAAAGPVGTAAVVKEAPASVPETPKIPPKEQDPAYWIEKGSLLSTYGYDKAAVNAYKKAVALAPADPAAFFNLGVSYGQIGQYRNALTAMDKAIALDPRKGLYYYGRGRIYLLQGDPLKGVADIQTAAELGSEDARFYLEKH